MANYYSEHTGAELDYVIENAILLENIVSVVRKNMYRIGDIIFTTTNTNPEADYGGTWVAWGSGRVPVGVDAAQTEFNTVGKTGGSNTHTLTTNQLPAHTAKIFGAAKTTINTGTTWKGGGKFMTASPSAPYADEDGTSQSYIESATIGSGSAHNNLQPYITCYMWRKTA